MLWSSKDQSEGKPQVVRFFNTAGPVNPVDHYCLPSLERLQLHEVFLLIEQKKYFVLHAPRQTGKTSALLALMDALNTQGMYRCVYMNVEVGQAAREDIAAAMQAIRGELVAWAKRVLHDSFVDEIWDDALQRSGPYGVLGEVLSRWSEHNPKPLVVLIDEIDALVGDTLIAVLRQLRAGYARRPQQFPHSVVLCGVRDIRDYRIHSGTEQAIITGGSAFNVKAESLRLGDFSRAEMETLYRQHEEETGQQIVPAALDRLWELSQGQPWLVNALGYEACFRSPENRDRTQPLDVEAVDRAKEQLIRRRETHLDQLADKLQERRVRQVIEPVLSGSAELKDLRVDDLDYVRDLGLIRTDGNVRIANPIYQEIIPRQLVYGTEAMLTQETSWYVKAQDGQLNMPKLLAAFQEFFREHSEHWVERFQYKEAGPQLLLQAFLQRIVNSGGRIEREYGLGRRRTDLLVCWPYSGAVQKIVIELKIVHRGIEQTISAGVEQTWEYMDRCGAQEGYLVIFDRTLNKPWEEKLFQRQASHKGHTIQVWGM